MAKMRLLIIIIIIALVSGCNVQRHIVMPDKTIYTVDARKDDLVTFKKGDIDITVDGRPGPSMIEKVLSLLMLNLPDVEVSK